MLGVSIVLFVVLLAVLFAVAAVTAGFGDLMRPVFQDARPVGLPETKVGPDDLEALRFNVVLRGYKMTEVDAVLHRMAREIAERDAVLAELRGEGRAISFRPQPSGPGDEPTEVLAAYSDRSTYAGAPDDGTPAELSTPPAWNPDDYRTVRADQPTEALPGYLADDSTTLLPAVPDDSGEAALGSDEAGRGSAGGHDHDHSNHDHDHSTHDHDHDHDHSTHDHNRDHDHSTHDHNRDHDHDHDHDHDEHGHDAEPQEQATERE